MNHRDYVDLTADADAECHMTVDQTNWTSHIARPARTMTKTEYNTVIALIVLEQAPETLRKIAAVPRWQRDAVA